MTLTLSQEQERFNFEVNERHFSIIKELRELEQFSPLIQIKKIKDAKRLDLLELQGVASHILTNDKVVETVRRSFLEILSEKGDQNKYSFLWFDQIQKISPVTLPRFNEVELVNKINVLLEKKLAKYPDLLVRVKIEMLHDLLLLYPYVEETISDLNFWINNYINKLDFFNYIKIEQIAVTEEQKEMIEWINRLDALSQREQMFSEE